jgi:hypothetical protein
MRYRLFNGVDYIFHRGDPVPTMPYTGQVVVAIDPSKTNCAMVVGDPGGDIISIVEMSGNNWSSGPVDDTTEYCSDMKDFISRYLDRVEIYSIGLEQAITKRGMEHHHSNMVLTEIRGTLLNLFLEKWGFHKEKVEVNNWSWKRAILPEGYRSQNEKGSKRYFSQYLHDPTYDNYYEADVTDSLCIYKYLIRECKDMYEIACRKSEEPIKDFKYLIMPEWADGIPARKFRYNPSFTARENAIYFANRSFVQGIAEVDCDRLDISEIYGHSSGFSDIPKSRMVRLVVYP